MLKTVVTGIGITSAIGRGKERFAQALFKAESAFGVMRRLGRQKDGLCFIGAEIPDAAAPRSEIAAPFSHRMSLCSQLAVDTLHEAWVDATLDEVPPERIGLIVAGSNLQQRDIVNAVSRYSERPAFVGPSYALSLWDTDLCGVCTQMFPIRGLTYSLGGASASGQVAVIQARDLVSCAALDACVVLGALTDVSYLEFQSFRNLGAMGTTCHFDAPHLASRPFDRAADGFIYGEACGALVIETLTSAQRRNRCLYGELAGSAMVIAGTRGPQPNRDCEIAVIRKALLSSGLVASDIDYVNPHGSGSPEGDAAELDAIVECGLSKAFINSTKSITGHSLSAAGAVEIIATLLQMDSHCLHPSRNLNDPLVPSLNWVVDAPVKHNVRNALCLSYGFGGINSALCISNAQSGRENTCATLG